MRWFGYLLAVVASVASVRAADPPPLAILYLGDNGHHQPAARFAQLQPALAARNISLTYTDKLEDLNPKTLAKYDGLMVYANHPKFTDPAQEKALLDYVASGKGFIPLHCASYCFIDSKPYVDLVGAQFRSHTTGVFRTELAASHPVTAGYAPFESWDETYVHHKHNEADRIVLETRAERDLKEPWTWVRTHGKGRVFYTAWGHDQRTWSHPGFVNLVERGTRWACGQDPALAGSYADHPPMTPVTGPKSDFEYVPAKVPFYPPTRQAGGNNPITTMQKPLSPEKSVKHYSVPVGMELKLFAADEQFGGKPIAITWDERGRLWVAVTVDYPNEMQPQGEGRDKILILEDTDGDGKADKITTFADKLSIPTSLIVAHGGLIVHQAPHTLFLKDTDGDGKADLRQVLFTGWGTGDTHAGPSNLRYGFDNWFYGSVGYSGFVGQVAGERQNFRQGYYRFKIEPTGDAAKPLNVSKFEFLRSTSNNTWGLAFSEDGQIFGSTANGCVLVHLPIPNRYYEMARGLTATVLAPIALDNRYHPITDKIRQVDWHGGFTSAANCSIYTARTYPPEYWNKTAFVSDPTGHLTATFGLQAVGTDYLARYAWNLAAADDEWAAPIEAQVGPDGHMWLIDWYAYIVQHNPTPVGFQNGRGNAYETPLRDKVHGRIYRLVATKAEATPATNLAEATPEKLVATLKNPNMLWRQHAQRLLVERNQKDVVPALVKLTEDRSVDAVGLNPAVQHALLTLQGLNALGEVKLADLMKHRSASVRRTAVSMANDNTRKAILDSGALADPDATVRLAALLALAEGASDPAVGAALAKAAVTTEFNDKGLTDALTIAASRHAPFFLAAIAAEPKIPARVQPLLGLAARSFAATTQGENIDILLAGVAKANPEVQGIILGGLTAGWPAGRTLKLNPESEKAIASLLASAPPTAKARLLKLAAGWGVKGLEAQLGEVTSGLLATVADAKADEAARIDAARQAIEFKPDDEAIGAKLIEALNAQTSLPLASGILEALSLSKAKTLGPALLAKLPSLSPSLRPVALRLVLARPESTKAFLDAVEAGKLRFDVLALDQKTALSTHPDQAIATRARKMLAMGGGLPDPDRQKVIEQFKTILTKSGDPAGGKKLFVQHCAKCHKHGNEGQTIGPDLTGMAVHPKEELLIHILDPSRSVEGNYKSYTAKLLDGRVVTGLLSSESKTAVELLDAENKRHALQRDDLEELKESPKSLMPEGFEKQMKTEELSDLLEFLTQKGKYVPVPLDKVATIVSTKGMFFDEAGTTERLVFRDWSPKTFKDVPFILVDPQGDRIKNVVMLHSTNGIIPKTMPKSVTLPCNTPAKAVHLLSGVGGWNFPATEKGTVSMIVRLHYADGKTEDHQLKNGIHFADYIRRVDVPESQFAFALRSQQIRYLSVTPKRNEMIKSIEFVKGPDSSAPVVMAVTVETP